MLLFILSWAIEQLIFTYWLYFLIKHCFLGYFTVFTLHIYFIILISMIAGNLVEIRLPKIQSRKCLQKYNLWRYSRECLRKFSTRLDRRSYQPTTCLNPQNFFLPRCLKCSLPIAYRIFDLLLVVVFFHYVIYCCRYHEPLR